MRWFVSILSFLLHTGKFWRWNEWKRFPDNGNSSSSSLLLWWNLLLYNETVSGQSGILGQPCVCRQPDDLPKHCQAGSVRPPAAHTLSSIPQAAIRQLGWVTSHSTITSSRTIKRMLSVCSNTSAADGNIRQGKVLYMCDFLLLVVMMWGLVWQQYPMGSGPNGSGNMTQIGTDASHSTLNGQYIHSK